jgi:penicillin-binding protein 1A
MEAGPHAGDVMVVDEPVKIGNWEPQELHQQVSGPDHPADRAGPVDQHGRRALANEVGTSNVAATARRLGITSKIQLEPSMALGAVEVSPMEMAQAYAPVLERRLPGQGLRHRAHPHGQRQGPLRPRRRQGPGAA